MNKPRLWRELSQYEQSLLVRIRYLRERADFPIDELILAILGMYVYVNKGKAPENFPKEYAEGLLNDLPARWEPFYYDVKSSNLKASKADEIAAYLNFEFEVPKRAGIFLASLTNLPGIKRNSLFKLLCPKPKGMPYV